MSSTATLTSKGQTTIPKEIRKHLKLKAGDRLEFVVEADGRVLLLPATVCVRDLKGVLPKPKKPVSLDEMEDAIKTGVTRLRRRSS